MCLWFYLFFKSIFEYLNSHFSNLNRTELWMWGRSNLCCVCSLGVGTVWGGGGVDHSLRGAYCHPAHSGGQCSHWSLAGGCVCGLRNWRTTKNFNQWSNLSSRWRRASLLDVLLFSIRYFTTTTTTSTASITTTVFCS